MIKLLLPLLLFAPAWVFAQGGFRYDTIPSGQTPSRGGFRLETPANQSDNAAATTQTTTKQAAAKQTAAKEKTGFDRSKLVIGGGIGLNFSDGYSTFSLSPQLGYAFNRYITLGGGLSYNYYRWSGYYTQTQNYLGANLYARFSPIPYIQVQAQPELYGMWGKVGGEKIPREMVPACLIGGGISFPTGARGGMSAMILYDVIQNKYSPYGNRLVYSVGYTYAF